MLFEITYEEIAGGDDFYARWVCEAPSANAAVLGAIRSCQLEGYGVGVNLRVCLYTPRRYNREGDNEGHSHSRELYSIWVPAAVPENAEARADQLNAARLILHNFNLRVR
jgi:hypothetical protein